jgi:hypothetical protein
LSAREDYTDGYRHGEDDDAELEDEPIDVLMSRFGSPAGTLVLTGGFWRVRVVSYSPRFYDIQQCSGPESGAKSS